MNVSIRASEHTLRLAGLLPEDETNNYAVSGVGSMPQPGIVSQVFGKPIVTEDKTVIPVASLGVSSQAAKGKQHASGRGLQTGVRSGRPIAIIEVDKRGTRVRGRFDRRHIVAGGMLLGCWNAYWIVRAVREWHRLRASSPIKRKRPAK